MPDERYATDLTDAAWELIAPLLADAHALPIFAPC